MSEAPSALDLSIWEGEMRLHVSEQELYFETLRKKGKPVEMMAMMESRLETRRAIHAFLKRLAAENPWAPPGAAAEVYQPAPEPPED